MRGLFTGLRKVCILKEEDLIDEFYWQDYIVLHFNREESNQMCENFLEMSSRVNDTNQHKKYPHIIEVSIVSNFKINQTHLEMCEIFKSVARLLAIQW